MGRPSSKRFKMSESTKRGLNRMNRKDLEQLVLEKTVEVMTGVYILQMTHILFPWRTDPAPKIIAIEGNPTPPK